MGHEKFNLSSEFERDDDDEKKSIEDFDCKLHISLYIRMMIIRRAVQSRTNRPFVPVTRAQEAKGRGIDEMSS